MAQEDALAWPEAAAIRMAFCWMARISMITPTARPAGRQGRTWGWIPSGGVQNIDQRLQRRVWPGGGCDYLGSHPVRDQRVSWQYLRIHSEQPSGCAELF